MKAVYFSLTGNTRKFVNKLGVDSLELDMANPFIKLNDPYIIVTPTYDKEATDFLEDFIEFNEPSLFKGVVGSGNLNFANLFVFTAKDLQEKYDVPLLHAFEYSGTEDDVNKVKTIIREISNGKENIS